MMNNRNKKARESVLLEQTPSCASLGYPDSNQERQDQNLQCYHYTIAQEDNDGIPRTLSSCYRRLGYPDSNQERQDQNLQCYHYTIAQ